MIGVDGALFVGEVTAIATNGQRSPEEWARIAAGKIVQISDGAPQPIRDQAHAFEASVRRVIANYIQMALNEERALVAARLTENS